MEAALNASITKKKRRVLMKNLKKLMALATALTLAFSLNITSFAAETCKGPNVGAASYTMTEGQTITWYMTTNYFNHF